MSFWSCPPPAPPFSVARPDPSFLDAYTPPCQPVLDDPFAILSDPERWPRHLCFPLFLDSTESWTRQALVTTDETLISYKATWPLPIGREALRREGPRLGTGWTTLLNVAPFPGDERAALALRLSVADQTIDLFGLAMPGGFFRDAEGATLEDAAGERLPSYRLGPLRAVVRGDDPTCKAVADLLRHARRWWARFSGQTIGPGRPVGSRIYPTRESLLAAFGPPVRELRRKLGRDPRASEVLRYVRRTRYEAIEAAQLARWYTALGWPNWRAFLSDVTAE